MNRTILLLLAVLMLVGLLAPAAIAADGQKLQWTGINYTKFLWGNRHYDGSMYNFTTIPGEGWGDSGQGTEFEMLFASKPSDKIEVNGRIKSRFNQNQWTNWGGFGGNSGAVGSATGGDAGEYDPRSNEYIKLRGITVNITPGYRWLNRAIIGSSDFGMFDPFTIGKIRYIDRDNGKGLFFNGSFLEGKLNYDVARVSLSRLWSGPNYVTGEFTSMDAAYGVQLRYRPMRNLGITGIFDYLSDLELDPNDTDVNDGRDTRMRQRNQVFGAKADYSHDLFDLKGAAYYAKYYTLDDLGTAGLGTYTAYSLGNLDDWSYTIDGTVNDVGGTGLALNMQYFDIGADWVSVMAARRESDVLLTEGHESTWYYPNADNSSYGGNNSVAGYAGFMGHAQQVATTNVDNEFTDFNEPLAETCIGWKGFTVVPSWGSGDLDITAEFSYIDYNTNWQMWGDDTMYTFNTSPYVTAEPDAGFGSFRNAYMPFQEKTTLIYMVKLNYYLDLGNGVDVHARWKFVDEEDLRIDDEQYLPANNADVAARFTDSPDGYWADFDSLDDDDKQMDMYVYELGAGYQLTGELYCDLTWQYYDVDLVDGNTAFQANRVHVMAGGSHKKNIINLHTSYLVGGAEFGMDYQWAFGEWAPDFGDGYIPVQSGDEVVFRGANGDVSLETQEYTQGRMKAYMKLLF